MKRLLFAIAFTLTACATATPTSTAVASLDAFIGQWNSITPGREFIRLNIAPLSSRQGALGARLTFSGLAWDGSGSIDQDAFVATMGATADASTTRKLVVRSTATDTIEAHFGEGANALALTLVRAK